MGLTPGIDRGGGLVLVLLLVLVEVHAGNLAEGLVFLLNRLDRGGLLGEELLVAGNYIRRAKRVLTSAEGAS